MDYKLKVTTFLLLMLSQLMLAQRGNVWVFGDSAIMNLSQPGQSLRSGAVFSLGTSAISDTSGNLLFYTGINNQQGFVYNNSHQIMNNGSGIINRNIFHSNLILPWPSSDSLYCFFHTQQLNSTSGVYYSIINPLKYGVGEVTQKNISIQDSVTPTDVLSAVRHGNGRDWWIFWRNYDYAGLDTSLINAQKNNTYYSVLLTPNGVGNITSQNIGSLSYVGSYGDLTFNKSGTQVVYASYKLLELFDFDRCTGLFTNPINIIPDSSLPNYRAQIGAEFSDNGRFLYVSDGGSTSYLYQYDLQAPNVLSSRQVLDSLVYEDQTGTLERWVDGKIYISNADSCITYGNFYPYHYTTINTHLSVINNPDVPYPKCNYVKNGYYLNGARTYQSLPNNPNYDLGVAIGSPCDTLSVGIAEHNESSASLLIAPNPATDKVIVSYKFTNRNDGWLEVYDILGKLIHKQRLYGSSTQLLLYTNEFKSGLYIVKVFDESKRINGSAKFLKQ